MIVSDIILSERWLLPPLIQPLSSIISLRFPTVAKVSVSVAPDQLVIILKKKRKD